MVKKVNAQMATEIALDTLKSSNSLKNLTQVVKSATSAWKSQETALKSAGDYLKASEARYNGLTESISRQQAKIEALKSKQEGLNVETKEGASLHLKYQQQIEQATTQLNSMTAQQERARQSMELQKNGVVGLNQQIKQSEEYTKSLTERMRAEGKETEALVTEKKGLQQSLDKQNDLYKKEASMLTEISERSGKTSDAYQKQQIRVNELGTKMATTKNRMSELNSSIKDIKSAPFNKVKSALIGINEKADKTHSLFGTIFSANLLSNIASSAWSKLTSSIGEAKDSAMEYATAQQTMNATWLTLTGNAKEGQKMVDMTNDMAVAAANSTDMVDGMNQKFYAITKNADITQGLTKSVLTLQDAFGASDDAVMNFSTQFAQMQANGKVSAQDMMSFVNTFPVLRTELLKTEQQQTHNSKLTMAQMNDLMSSGKISSETMDKVLTGTAKKYSSATENFAKTVPGLSRTIKSQMPVLIGNITKPLLELKNPVLGAVSSWITDNKTHKKFTELGANFSKELSGVISSFTGGGNAANAKKNLFDTLNGAIDGFNKAISATFGYISDHARDIKGIASDSWTIAKTIGGSVWDTFKEIIKTTADWLGVGGKNAKSMKDPLTTVHDILDKIAKNKDALKTTGKVIVGLFVAKKALSFAGGLLKVYDNLKKIKDVATDSKLTSGLSGLINGKALGGVGQSLKSAGGVTGLSTAGKVATGLSVAGIGMDAGMDITKAFTSKSMTKKFESAGSGVGKAVGGGIGLFFGGPLGAALGTQIGGFVGKWGGKAAKGFTDGWNKAGKGKKPEGWLEGLGWDARQMTNKVSKWWDGVVETNKKANAKQQKAQDKANKEAQKNWNSFWSRVGKGWTSYWSDINKKSTKQNAKRQKDYDAAISKIKKSWNKFWDDTSKNWNSFWGKVGDKTKSGIGGVHDKIDSGLTKISKGWKSMWSGLGDFFGSIWSGIKDYARSGINGVIGIINGGIGAINNVWKFFTGKKALSKLKKLAQGGLIRSEERLVMVNDDGTSNYKELIQLPTGHFMMPSERNQQMMLPVGSRVYNSHETKQIMNMAGVEHYANGGLVGKIEEVGKWVAHPVQSVTDMLKKATSGMSAGNANFTNLAQSTIDKLLSHIVDWFKKGLGKVQDSLGGSEPSGTGSGRWKATVIKALSKVGLPTSAAYVNAWLKQIQTESGGNAKAVQHGYTDINTLTGNLAQGLLQTIPPTFNAYKMAGHGNILNGYDNMLAAMQYAKSRYGKAEMLSVIGHGHGYANGGIVNQEQFARVAENNRPEMIIPMDAMKRSRAWQLISQVVGNFVGDEPSATNSISPNDKGSENQQLNQLIELIGTLVGNTTAILQILAAGGNSSDVRALLLKLMPGISTEQLKRQSLTGRGITIDNHI